jgi:hypothetical protein
MYLGAGIRDAFWGCIMLLALIPALLSIAMFVATLRLKPTKVRGAVLPRQALPR